MCIYIIVDLQEVVVWFLVNGSIVFHFDWVINVVLLLKPVAPTGLKGLHTSNTVTPKSQILSWLLLLVEREPTAHTAHTIYWYGKQNCEGGTFKHAQSTVTILKQPPSHFAHLTRGPCASQLAYCQSAGVILHESSVTKQRRVLVPGSA